MDEFVEDVFGAEGFLDALQIARLNTRGQLHLVGEVVIETIAHALYGHPRRKSTRYHFLTDEIIKGNILRPYWRLEPAEPSTKIPPTRLPPDYFKDVMTSRYYANEQGIHVTLTEFCAIHPIILDDDLAPTLAGYLKTAPLTTDALALDIENRKLWGDAGKQAILDRRVEINNLAHLIYKSFLARLSAHEYIKAHADRLEFNYDSTV